MNKLLRQNHLFKNTTIAAFFAIASFLFALPQQGLAQQVFPVLVNGSLVPPHSLAIQDYAFDKSEDIMFFVTLNDPIEQMRAVRFRLTIMSDGQEILMTSPNFFPPPIILEKDIMQMINGADLAAYFNPLNLVRVDGGGAGNGLLPSGFNSFCLEVIDVEREIPISDKFCASGIFELAQPPILNTPFCHTDISIEDTPNMLFSWTAMHQLSLNQPTSVEYEFTLIKLLPGIADPNDGFNFSIPVFQTTQAQTVLYYYEDNPLLEAGETYAWRVRALDIFGNDVFQNDGYSDICTFTVTGDAVLPDDGDTGNFACGDGGCDWNGTLSNEPFSGNISEGDKINVGNFKMQITQISDNGGTYSGEGTIYIPFLFSKLKVAFNNISINQDGRVFNGQISSTTDNDSIIPSMFSLDNMGDLDVLGAAGDLATEVANNFSDATATALENHFDGSGQTNLVSFLKDIEENSAIPIGLPIGIDKTIEETNSKLTIAVTGIKFTPTRANLNAVLMTKFEDGGEYLKFGARGICFQPGGIAAPNPILELLTDADLSSTGVPLTLVGMENGESRTYLSFDCNGFEEFSLTGRHEFDNELIFPKDNPEGQIVATVQTKTRSLKDFIATSDPIGDFQFKGAEDFVFNIGSMSLDLSPTQNPEGIAFPEEFPEAQANETFKGFFLSDASVALPDVFSSTTDGAIPELIGTSILYTTDGFTGNLLAENLIDLSVGDLGGWGYSLDSAYLKIVNNSFNGSGFIGKMRLPIMSDTEFMKYMGTFTPGDLGVDINFEVLPDIVSIDLLRAQFEFDPTSKISIGRLNGAFQKPKVDLNGILKAKIPEGDPGFLGDIMAEIQGLVTDLGIEDFVPKLDMEGIRFDGFKIDLDAADKFQIGSIMPVGLDLNFLGLDCDISSINFDKLSVPDLTNMDLNVSPGTIVRALDFNMDFAKDLLGIAAPEIRFSLVINELPTIGGGNSSFPKFEFGGFNLDFSAGGRPSFECGQDIEEIVVNASAANLYTEQVEGNFETLKIGHFDLTPTSFTKDENGVISGLGTVQVPILGPLSKLGVSFTDLKIDLSGRIVEGEVVTDAEAGLFNSPELGGLLSNVQDQVDDAFSAANDALELPVILGVQADGETERDQGLILVGLVFGTTEAKAQAKVVFEIGTNEDGTTKYAEFKAEGLTLVPDGIANFDLKVGLGADLAFQPMEGMNPLIFKAFEQDSDAGSFVSCDCSGFLEFQLEGEYEFPQEQLVSLDDPSTPVKAAFKFNTKKWGSFIGNMQSMGNFTVPGLDGFDFVVSDAYLDFSKDEDLEELVFPNEYVMPDTANHWRGFFIKEIGLTLPEDFVLSEGGERPSFNGQNLLIDNQGVSASISGNNVLQGEIDGWAFNLDSIGVNILTNNLVESAVKGSVGIPLIDDPMPYVGTLVKDSLDFYQMKLAPDGTTRLNIAALKSYIDIGENTEIVLQSAAHPTIANKTQFRPYANLWGGVGISVTNDDFNNPEFTGQLVQDAKTIIEDLIGVPLAFVPPAITFEGLKINHPSLPDTSRFGLDNYAIEGGIKIGDYELGLKDLKMLESAAMDFKNNGQQVTLPGVGLSFSLGIPLINIDVQFWAKEQTIGGKQKFNFGKIILKTNTPKFSCEGGCPEPPTDQNVASSNVNVGDSFKAGDFTIDVTAAGKGEVMVGFLNTKLNVDFENIELNAAGELIGGTVTTAKDGGLFAGDLIQVGVEGESIQLPLMDELTNAVNDVAKLPFSLNEFIKTAAEIEDDLPFDFVVVGLRFTSEGAKMDAAMMFKTPGEAVLKFGATGLCFTQEGVNLDQIKVYLAEEITLDDIEFPLTILPGSGDGDDGSYATFSCSGVDNFHLQAKYDFPINQLIPVDETKSNVAARFTIKSEKWGQFIASATMDEFMVAGVDDVAFTIEDAYIDYSDTQNPENFPEDYFTGLPNELQPTAQNTGNGNNIWRGFYLKKAAIKLPEAMSLGNGSDRISLEGNDLIYDRGNGFSASASANNLVNISDGKLNGWGISLDKVEVEVKFNSPEKFSLEGLVYIPITGEGENIPYTASVNFPDAIPGQPKPKANLEFALALSNTYTIPMLNGASMKLENSTAGFSYVNGKFEPFANLNGDFAIDFKGGGAIPADFKIPKLGFQHLTINYDWKNTSVLSSLPNSGGLSNIDFGAFSFAGRTFEADGSSEVSEDAATQPTDEKAAGFPIAMKNIKFGSEGDFKKLDFSVMVNFTSPKNGGKGIAASTNLSILGNLNISKVMTSEPWKALEFEELRLNEIALYANMGGIIIEGGLKVYRKGELFGGVDYGDGFKGALVMTVDPAIKVSVVGQFGSMTKTNGDLDYRYWFADAKFMSKVGVKVSFLGIYGFGGGAYYNMTRQNVPTKAEAAAEMVTAIGSGQEDPPPTEGAPAASVLSNPKLLEPGYALSGIKYVPLRPTNGNTIGLSATLVFGLSQDKIFNADATLSVEFNTSDGINSINLDGAGYFMAAIPERENAKLTADLGVSIDFKKKELLINLSAYLDISVGDVKLLYGAGTDQATGKPNKLGTASLFFNLSGESLAPWYVILGTPHDRLGIGTPIYELNGYFMGGMLSAASERGINVSPASFPPQLAQFDGNNASRGNYMLSSGNAFVFGAGFSIPTKKVNWAMFYASFAGGAGFDVVIQQLQGNCQFAAGGGRPGINGWMLDGQAYLWFDGSVGLELDFWPFDGDKFDILSVKIRAALQIQAPNPIWVKANLAGSYKILGGLVEGSFSHEVEFGDKCTGLNAAPVADPIAGVEIITDFRPKNGAQDIPVLVDEAMAVAFSIDMNKEFIFSEKGLSSPDYVDDLENAPRYKAKVLSGGVYRNGYPISGEFRIFKGNSNVFSGKVSNWDNVPAFNKLHFYSDAILQAKANYVAKIKVQWYKDEGNGWKTIGEARERVAQFKTGDRPKKIERSLFVYEAPGYRQRNWTKEFADGKIKFDKKGFGFFFNPVKAGIEYNYFMKVHNLTSGTTQKIEFSQLPRPEYASSNVGNTFVQLGNNLGSLLGLGPIETEIQPSWGATQSNVKYVDRGDDKTMNFNKINTAVNLSKNAIYQLEIIGEPIDKATWADDINDLFSEVQNIFSDGGGNFVSKRVTKLGDAGTSDKVLPDISMYNYHFKTSKYSYSHQKIQNLTFDGKYNLKSYRSLSGQGTSESYTFAKYQDNSFRVYLKGDEIFDDFDLARIDLNVTTANNENHPWFKDYKAILSDNSKFQTIKNYRNKSYYITSSAWWKSNENVAKLLEKPTLEHGIYLMPHWNYKSKTLTDSEISNGSPDNYNGRTLVMQIDFDRVAQQQVDLIQHIDNSWAAGQPDYIDDAVDYFEKYYHIKGSSSNEKQYKNYISNYEKLAIYRGKPSWNIETNFLGMETNRTLKGFSLWQRLQKANTYTGKLKFHFYVGKSNWGFSEMNQYTRSYFGSFELPISN